MKNCDALRYVGNTSCFPGGFAFGGPQQTFSLATAQPGAFRGEIFERQDFPDALVEEIGLELLAQSGAGRMNPPSRGSGVEEFNQITIGAQRYGSGSP